MTKRNKNNYPLRKVVGHSDDGREILECGHKQAPRQDMIGTTNAYRRRCWQCERDRLVAKGGAKAKGGAS